MTVEPFDDKSYDDRATVEDIYNCYRLILGRAPDEQGWKTLTALVDQLTVDALALIFLSSSEFKNRESYQKMLGQDQALPVVAQCDGFKLYVSPNDAAVGQAILTAGSYEPHVTAIIKKTLKPGMTFVDVGANIGYFSLMAAKQVGGGGKVLAFEPGQRSCTLLQMSATLNHRANIEIYPFAVADQDASVIFDTMVGSNGMISPTLDAEGIQLESLAHKTLVRSVRLDGILAHLQRIDVIKMDIEGAEYRAMVGAQELIQKHRPIIFFEYSPGLIPGISGVPGRDLLLLFTDMDYTLSIIEYKGGVLDCVQDLDKVLDYFEQQSYDHIDLVAYPNGDRAARNWLKPHLNRLRPGRQS